MVVELLILGLVVAEAQAAQGRMLQVATSEAMADFRIFQVLHRAIAQEAEEVVVQMKILMVAMQNSVGVGVEQAQTTMA